MSDSLVRVSRRGKEDHFLRPGAPGPKLTAGRDGAERAPATGRAREYEREKWQRPPLITFGSLSAISGTLSLSFQSSFHLSFTVLVRYRSPTRI